MSCTDDGATPPAEVIPLAFRVATIEEVWEGERLVERRLSHGEAVHSESRLIATDERDEELVRRAEAGIEKMQETAASLFHQASRLRLVAESRSGEETTLTITMRVGPFSIVTTPEHAVMHYELAAQIAEKRPEGRISDYRGIPILWRNGSGAVLLHEAAGHAAEHEHAPLPWPRWLSVTDGGADLLAGEPPPHFRRASFRDVPLRRMQELLVQQNGAPYELPERRIEVLLVDGGAYEPLDETITVGIAAADLVEGETVRRLERFEIAETRAAVAAALAGAEGVPLRYPGVVCSREGQEIVVGSLAPLLVTVF
jgi:hypothetical protein